jgi:hypothetical protein
MSFIKGSDIYIFSYMNQIILCLIIRVILIIIIYIYMMTLGHILFL